MSNKKLIDSEKFLKFLDLLKKKISNKEFQKGLIRIQEIDLKHYMKKIKLDELNQYISEYQELEFNKNKYEKLQILLPGNPDVIFKICLNAIRYDVNMIIGIEDFCLAQNTFIVETINEIITACNLKNKIEIKNLLKDNEIIEISNNVDLTICIGNSNLYNRLSNKIKNIKLNPYGIFELYSDSEEFKELQEKIFEYSVQNQFELELYDELEFEEAVEAMNRDGYKFCSILISKEQEKIKKFKENIDSKYIIVNENPFKKINFEFSIF